MRSIDAPARRSDVVSWRRLAMLTRALLGRRAPLASAALAIAFTADQASKWLILAFVMVPPRTIELAPFLNLTLGFNTGISFGILRDVFLDRPLLLAAIALAIAAGLTFWALRVEKRIETFALSLIAGGAIGNVADRIRLGAVTDFLDFHVGDWHWPAFNLADVAITIGVIGLLASVLLPLRSTGSAGGRSSETGR